MIGLPKAILVRHYAPFSLLLILGASCTNRDLTPTKPAFAIQDGAVANGLSNTVSGSVSAWGFNREGELGNGTNTTTYPQGLDTPGPVSGLTGVTAIAGGQLHSLALQSDGTVWAWGYNGNGQLGNGTQTDNNTPVQVLGPGGVGYLTGVTALAVGGSNLHSLVVKSDGTVWAWGLDNEGELGNGTTFTSFTPVQVLGPGGVGYLTGVTALAVGFELSLALQSDGTVWAWGYNGNGELGNGTFTFTDNPTPVQVLGLSGVTAIAGGGFHSLALKSDGTVWAWGYNADGELGNGTFTNSNAPVQVLGLSGVTAIAGGGFHSLALKSDGTVWAWGYNAGGNAPVQVLGLSGMTAIAGLDLSSLALKGDGTVWAWGSNAVGQLGDGTFTPSNAPVEVLGPGGVGYLTGVTAIAGGGDLTGAVQLTQGFAHSLALVGATPTSLAIVPPPAITVATDVGRCDAQVSLGTATTTGGTPPITLAANPAAGPYLLGTTTVTWTATDASGTTASATQSVTVRDQELPSVVTPPNVSTVTDPGKPTASVSPGVATSTDNCPGGTVTGARNDGQALNAPYPVGQTIITWTATDASANTANASQSVTVADNEPPSLGVPADFAVNATSPAGAVVTYAVTASDNVSVASSACNPASGTTFPIGSTSVTCVASDPSGNRASATFHVTVLSAQAQISNLETSVTNLALSTGTTTSLLAKLNGALAAANAGDVATACASLQDFINQTRAQAGKKIAISDANTLSVAAQRIRAVLGC